MHNDIIEKIIDAAGSFPIAVNVCVDYLVRLTMSDADVKDKYAVVTKIVDMTIRHLREDEMPMDDRLECEALLAFYQFLQALYESRFNPLVTQVYVNRLAEIYNEKRKTVKLPDILENCDFLRVGIGWKFVDFDKYKLIKNL